MPRTKHRAALLALALISVAACRRADTIRSPGPAGDAVTAPPPPRDATASAADDTLVLVPGVGVGPFALGASRAAIAALGTEVSPGAATVVLDGVSITFGGDAPGGEVTALRVRLADARAGLRVGEISLAASAGYPEVVSALGPCAAPIANRGATVTPCQGGGVKIIQAGPAQELWLDVSR